MLTVNRLSKEYTTGILRRKKIVAVDDVSFDMNPGEILGIVGGSGSGKSTIAQCITKLITPTKGEVLFHGRDVFQDESKGIEPGQKKNPDNFSGS